MQTTNLRGLDLLHRRISFVHDQPVNASVNYILTNPYSAKKIKGKWHLNNIFPSVSHKNKLSLQHDFPG